MFKFSYYGLYLFICLAFLNCQSPKPVEKISIPTNPAPVEVKKTFTTLKNKGDFQALLADQKGKVTLVNLWATWCKPCIHEMPALEKIHQNYQAKGVKIIALSLDDFEKADSLVPPYWDSQGFSMDSYLIGTKDPSEVLSKVAPLWMGVIPTSFIFNAQGEKVETISGTLNYEGFEQKILAVLNASN